LSLLICEEALGLVTAAESADPAARTGHRQAVEALEHEIGGGRRIGLSVIALAGIVLGGVFLAVAADSIGDDAGLVALGVVLGLALGVPGALLGIALVRTGERIVRAHAVWAADDLFGSPSPGTMVQRLLSGRWLLRSALTAAALIAAVFSWAFFGLGIAPSDPLDAGSSQVMLAVLGLVWAVAFTATTWYLLMGEIRMGRAHSKAVIRGR
jgi:hypothetical protein